MIIEGDALIELSKLEGDSIDLIATDPPYGLAFMGKDWDKAVPSVAKWKECLRVLKPGAFAFVMCIPRQDCLARMICNLSDAGFETGFTSLYWTYSSGFPKAQNIGKAVDKRGVWNDEFDNVRTYLRKKVKEKGLTHKDIDSALGNVNSHLASHYLGISQPMLPTWEQWLIIKQLLGLDEDIDNPPKCIGYERAILGYRKVHQGVAFSSEGASELPITEPASPQAKALDGSYAGFQPKPAVEVILVAMKPMEQKTFVDQALKNQKGITWLDDCRIPYEEGGPTGVYGTSNATCSPTFNDSPDKHDFRSAPHNSGRFPANLLVSDDVLNNGEITKSGKDAVRRQEGMFIEHHLGGVGTKQVYHPDSGSFSRYFDLDRWFAEKIKQLPTSVQKTFPFLICPKASKREKNKGVEDIEGELGHNRFDQCAICGGYILQNPDRPSACKCETPIRQHNKVKGNFHPTCKPLKLMSYLITLGSREGDTVLDPFVGSGTTCLAAKMLGRKSIGIEIKRYYFEIAKGRNEAASK